MPGRDGTGPLGQGAMTGWGAGLCQTPRRLLAGRPNAGRGRGVGRGAGRRSWWYPADPETAAADYDDLKQQAGSLRRQLRDVESRLAELGQQE